MDRILDSGSNDWGSTPHGCTISPLQNYKKICRLIGENGEMIKRQLNYRPNKDIPKNENNKSDYTSYRHFFVDSVFSDGADL